MLYFVTLFDKKYLSRGIILYESLKERCKKPFVLYVLAMDTEVEKFFSTYEDSELIVESLLDVMECYPNLKDIRKERKEGEFCWTLSPFSVQYIIKKYELPYCIYLDSDLCFFNDPSELIEQIKGSVLITSHNYTPQYDQSLTSGKFCVQFMYFKNDDMGMEVLEWWRRKCEEWCFGYMDNGRYGDQKYLDDWESRFSEAVEVCSDIGCGVAPWNCQQYDFIDKDNSYYVKDKISKVSRSLIFFHFHGMTKLKDGDWIMSGYKLDDNIRNIYRDYIKRLENIEEHFDKDMKTQGKDNPYIIKNKLRYSLGQAKIAFNKSFFGKPAYKDNIYNAVK